MIKLCLSVLQTAKPGQVARMFNISDFVFLTSRPPVIFDMLYCYVVFCILIDYHNNFHCCPKYCFTYFAITTISYTVVPRNVYMLDDYCNICRLTLLSHILFACSSITAIYVVFGISYTTVQVINLQHLKICYYSWQGTLLF